MDIVSIIREERYRYIAERCSSAIRILESRGCNEEDVTSAAVEALLHLNRLLVMVKKQQCEDL